MKMEEINLSQLVVYQQEEEIRKNKSKRKVILLIQGFIQTLIYREDQKLYLIVHVLIKFRLIPEYRNKDVIFQKVRAINGPTVKTISRIRPIESNDQAKKVAAPLVEEISNLIPDYTKKVNVKIDNFVVFSSAGNCEHFQSLLQAYWAVASVFCKNK